MSDFVLNLQNKVNIYSKTPFLTIFRFCEELINACSFHVSISLTNTRDFFRLKTPKENQITFMGKTLSDKLFIGWAKVSFKQYHCLSYFSSEPISSGRILIIHCCLGKDL